MNYSEEAKINPMQLAHRHVHRILYVSTVSWVNLTITILPGPTRKPHILLLFWVTQCNTNVYYKLQVYYLSKVVTQY